MSSNQILNPALVTSHHANEIGLSDHNLLDELFQLEPHDDWGSTPLPPLRDQSGAIFTGGGQRQYLAFDLPTQISIRPEDWRLQYYTDRLDPRIQSRDIYLRMYPGPGDTLLKENAINMQKIRLRKALNIACHSRRKGHPDLIKYLEKEQISWDSVLRNTSLPALDPLGMIKPSLPNTTEPVPLNPPARLPLTRFTKGIDRPHVPSVRLVEMYQLILNLQCEAFERGCCHWIFLPNSAKPEEWVRKARSQRHSRTGPEDIKFPARQDINDLALAWIEDRVEAAAAGESDMEVPDTATLPGHSQGWVRSCIARGRARKAEKLQNAMNSSQQNSSDVETKQGEIQGEAKIDDDEKATVPQLHSYPRKRKGCSPCKRTRVSQGPSYLGGDIGTSAMQPNAKKRKGIASDSPNKRLKLETDSISLSPYGNSALIPSPVQHHPLLGLSCLDSSDPFNQNSSPRRQQKLNETIYMSTSNGLIVGNNNDDKTIYDDLIQSPSLGTRLLEAGVNNGTSTNEWSTEYTINGGLFGDVNSRGWNNGMTQAGPGELEYRLKRDIGYNHDNELAPNSYYEFRQSRTMPFGSSNQDVRGSFPVDESQLTHPFSGNPWTIDQNSPLIPED